MKSNNSPSLDLIATWNQFIVDCAVEHELPVGVVYEIAIAAMDVHQQIRDRDETN